MAEDVGGLYLRLGLSLSELETGFVTASQTVAANIARLNREANLIRLRTEVEIAGLDEATDGERILQLRTESLNRQMQIQRDRIRILTAEYNSLVAAHGETSVVAQRAATRLERERLSLANLERDLRNLNGATDETNGVFGELSEMLPSIPTKLQAIGVAFGAVTAGVGAAATATKELLNEFHELQNQAYELNMSFPDTRNFLREMRLAGGDIGDIEGYIRGITDAYVKGEYDDPEFIPLRKYDAKITDANGRLKSFKDIVEEVYQAWLKADAAGEGIEFLQLTGGEAGVRDIIQYFQRLKEVREEDAAKIFTAKIDEKQLHELDRTMNLVTEQSAELKAALGDIFTPAAQAAGEKFFQILHDGTQTLVENKDTIQGWGFIVAETIDTVSKKFGSFTDKLAEIAKMPKGTTGNAETDKIMSGMSWRYQDFNQQKPWGVNTSWDDFNKASESYGIFNGIIERAEEKQKAYNGTLKEANTAAEIFAKGLEALSEKQKENSDVLSQYGAKRVQQFKDELEDLRIELDFVDNDYEKALAQLELWKNRESIYKNFLSDEEKATIEELYSAKWEQIEQERADKIAEIQRSVDAEFKTSLENRIDKINEEKEAWISAGMEKAEAEELAQKRIEKANQEASEKAQEYWKNAADIEYSLTHTAFEKQIRDIELWKDAQLKKAETAEEVAGIIKNSAAKEAEAFENAMDRIRGMLQSLDDKIFAQEHSQFEQDYRRIQQERIRYYEDFQKQGILTAETQAKIEYWFNNAVRDLNRRAAKSRETGGDYTKSPEGGMQRGGNGIMVIGGDQILDDGLKSLQANIGVITTERNVREQLSRGLSKEAQDLIAANQATRALTNAQKDYVQQITGGFELVAGGQPTFQGTPVGSATIIQGEEVTQISAEDVNKVLEQYKLSREVLSQGIEQFGDTVAQPTQELQQFGDARLTKLSEIDLSEFNSSLTNIDAKLQSVLLELQTPKTQETTMTFETIVTPLNNIAGLVQNILTALSNRQPPQITVSPSNSINLGGAYVFDNAMKNELVNDITSKIVAEITSAVKQATNQSNYSYGA